MRYLGGKRRLAKHIRDVILSDIGAERIDHYYEPFIGGGAVGAVMGAVSEHVHYSDIHPDLILMWQALQDGWVPPTEVSVERYQELKRAAPSAERGFVGFGGSFGGRFFEGYAKGGHNANGTPRNHQAESARAVLKDIVNMQGNMSTTFTCVDYADIRPEVSAVVYCDPPYADTKHYSSTEKFDTNRFWGVAQSWTDGGAHVYVSSYQAPAGWTPVMVRSHRSSVRRGDDERHVAREVLYKFSAGAPVPVSFEQMVVG